MVVLVLKKCESYLYNESQFHIKYNNRTKHVLYIGIYPQYCIENISTQKKQDPIQRSYKWEKLYLEECGTGHQLKQIKREYVDYYNHVRPHESLNYGTPADSYYGSSLDTVKAV